MNGEIIEINGRDFIECDGRLAPAICGGADYALYIAAGAAVAALAASAVSAYGSYEQGQAQRQAAGYSQDVANQQADASRAAAKLAGDARAEELRRVQAAQRARIGASGIEPGEGSPLLVQMESSRQAQMELQRLQYAGETQATSFQSQGILQGFYGRQAQRAGNIGAGTSLLSGVSNATASGYGIYRAGKTA